MAAPLDFLALSLPGHLLDEMLKHAWWYLGRSAGFISYGLLVLSVVLGVGISSRIGDGLLARAWVFELHRFLSVFVLAVVLFHALVMLPDPYAKFTVRELLVPFQSHYRDGPMALGIITLYGLGLVTLSFYVTKLIGQKTWRALHYTTFLLFVSATAHGVLTGTDTKSHAVQVFYLGSATLVLFMVFYRVLALRSVKPKKKPSPASARPARPAQPGPATLEPASARVDVSTS
jgi:predicted ferric reductase